MTSIIICSKYSCINEQLKCNIEQTIGCDFEIILIDNSQNRYNIFSAYNEGVSKARGEILCFMHEDILFHTNNWGRRVENYLQDETIGMLGVAGMKVIPEQSDARMGRGFIAYQQIKHTTLEDEPRSILLNQRHKSTALLQEVAAVDGLWFCIPRRLFDAIRFDEDTYNDFHLYDIDTSLQILQQDKKVMVCDDIIMEHASIGTFNKAFSNNLRILQHKWKDILPLQRGISLTEEELRSNTNRAIKKLAQRQGKDVVVQRVRQKRALGDTHFTHQEKKCIERSIEVYAKYAYLNAKSKREAYNLFLSFMQEKGHSISLYMKFFLKFLAYGIKKKKL